MNFKPRTLFLFALVLVGVWFIYVERAILTPFILAGIFAYLFNPIVNFFTHKLKFPRILSILLIYGTITTILIFGGIILSSRVITESTELKTFINKSVLISQSQIKTLPDWIRPSANDLIMNLKHSRVVNVLSGQSLFELFPQAISRVISFLIFLFAAFYFLKEGEKSFEKLIAMTPSKYKIDVEILFRKINAVLGGYLRGQIFLVFLMSIVTYVALFILGVRFAFLIALFSGIAEIVPVVGPIVAGSVAVLVILFTGHVNFGLSPMQGALAVGVIYFIFRQLEDYFVIPYVMSKITKLPSFIIFFAVVAGGHIAGLLGLILAVPSAAVLRLLLQFSFEKLHENGPRE